MVDRGVVERAFIDRLAADGIAIDPTQLEMDGKVHRLHVEGDAPRTKNLAYKIHLDDRPVAWFQDHKRGVTDSFRCSDGGPDLDPAEAARQRAQWAATNAKREQERQAKFAVRAQWARDVFKACGPATGHAYLSMKGISEAPTLRRTERLEGAAVWPGSKAPDVRDPLVVPLYSAYGPGAVFASLQLILPTGEKWFIGDGCTAGAFHPIPGPRRDRLLICEGVATGYALSRATGHPVVCAMTAGNLASVTAKMVAQYPDREILVMADNDHKTMRPVENPGLHFARLAAKPHGLRVVEPRFDEGADGTDWDDWLREGGEGAPDRLIARIEAKKEAPPWGEDGAEATPGEETVAAAGSGLIGRTSVQADSAATEIDHALPAPLPSTLPRLDMGMDDVPDAPAFSMPKVERGHALADDPESEAQASLYSEDNVALRFSELHDQMMRYVAVWGRWMRWEGTRWVHDEDGLVLDRVRKVCRSVADHARQDGNLAPTAKNTIATTYGAAKSVSAVERLARTDRRHAATVDQWDRDPWTINTPGGVVDLRTGKLRPADRDDYMTKITSCAPGGDCPTWKRFLDEATAGDKGLQSFLQRLAGYSLTGLTIEQKFFFLYGPGGNGKGTFINTLTWLLKDYAKVASVDMLTETRGERHPTELAALRGARMVSAQEVSEGKRWDEAKLKMLTGSDPVTARFMHKDEFEFLPQLKLIIAGNHKPGLRNVDEAIRRRFLLVPFTVKPKQKDITLTDKLQGEGAGILRWCIEGCLLWQQSGLQEPEVVRQATDQYFDAEDRLGQWIQDCCLVGDAFSAKSSLLYKSFKGWCEANGETAVSQKRWAHQMESREYRGGRTATGVMYRGICLQPDNDHPDWVD